MENPKRRMKTEGAATARGGFGEHDPRRRFTEDAAAYARANKMPQEEAKKELFRGLINEFNMDLGERRRFVSADSDLFEMQEAALAESVGARDAASFTAQGAGLGSKEFRAIALPPHTKEELESARQYLAERFKGARIIEPLAADYLDLTVELEEVVARLSADDRLKEAGSLSELFSRARDVRADIARMLEIKRRLALHEKHLLEQMRAKEAQRKLIEESRSYFDDAFAGPLADFFKVLKKNAPNAQNVVNVGAITFALLPLFAKFTFHTGKLLYRAAQSVPKSPALSLK